MKSHKYTGYIHGNNLYKRAYVMDKAGEFNNEPWYMDEDGMPWSAFDVEFIPDEIEKYSREKTEFLLNRHHRKFSVRATGFCKETDHDEEELAAQLSLAADRIVELEKKYET